MKGRGVLIALLWAAAPAQADSLGPGAAAVFALTQHAGNLGAVTDFRFLPDGRTVIVQKTGEVVLRRADGTLVTAATLPVDTESEKGLLGVEVDPAFSSNGFLYLYWSRADGAAGGTDANRHRVSRFTLGADALEPGSEVVLVENLIGPANHAGGALAIGPDGKLYVGVGDSGCNTGSPPGQNIGNWFATCLSNGNGKILRVNLDGTIPTDNPLVNEAAVTACGALCGAQVDPGVTAAPRTDVWAWGLRNPFRISFDPLTGNLWVADVGEVTFEELNVVKAGGHYGWPLREGDAGQDPSECARLTPQSGACTDPVYFCGRGGSSGGVDGQCQSITGGVFVDACSWPAPWRGRYFFGDNANGRLFFLDLNPTRDGPAAGGSARGEWGAVVGGAPVSFQVGPDGNLYVGVLGTTTPGRILKVAPLSPQSCAGTDGGVDGGAGADGGASGADGGGQTQVDQSPPDGPPGQPFEPDSCGCRAGMGATSLLLLAAILPRLARRRRGREAS